MGLNINVTTRRKQLAVLISVLAIAGAATAGIMVFGRDDGQTRAKTAPATPNMVGVVTATFDDKLQTSAMQQQQAATSALEQKVQQLAEQIKQNHDDFTRKLQEKDQQIAQLQQGKNTGSAAPAGNSQTTTTPGNTPLPGPLATGQARPAEWNVQPTGTGNRAGVNPAQGTGFYPGTGNSPRLTGGLDKTDFTYDSLKKKNETHLPWIPSGSFSAAVMIEGADANASVTGNQNTTPVTIRLIGQVQMPNNHEYDMNGCFVSGEIYGDISSERGEVRTSSISCILKNGKHVDMPFEGHVSYQGKEGIRGKPVMRNGKIIGYAGAAGFLSGIGDGIKSASTPTVGLGATASVSGLDVLKQGFGGGAEKAADTLSQYWIKRAEQYHPVIDIGAGNLVTVVFQKGFRLETLEDADAKKAEATVQKAGETVSNAVSSTTPTPSGSAGTLNPDEILRQARQLRLGDTIN
ncbi:F-type conjugal transfer pilus assembly protein TraB [Mangrovibacter phragmitis]|uniref:F-type conjugal transfer pilus assembly protein TraB n=1 Tax=Mangrovibacter phragmitis TaxID=1691903 RepID=UPI003515F414